MSSITLPASLNNSIIDTYTRTDGGNTVHVQAMVAANPLAVVTGNITSATSTVLVSATDAAVVGVTIAGTYGSVNISFEGSDDGGTTWYAVQAVRADANIAETTSGVLTNTARAWRINSATFNSVRVRATAWASGTALIDLTPSPYACEPAPYIPTHPVTQSGAWTVAATQSGTWNINAITTLPALVASTALIGDVAAGARATTTNALLSYKLISAATTNGAAVKASAGRVYGWQFSNTTAAFKFVKLYNLAVAPTVGTSVPVQTLAIPPNSAIQYAGPIGVFHATGIAIAVTGGAADTDATAVAVNDVIGSLYYA